MSLNIKPFMRFPHPKVTYPAQCRRIQTNASEIRAELDQSSDKSKYLKSDKSKTIDKKRKSD